jgi:sn-glycerol 3-phosphate transport system substrate-binding protein
LVADFNASHTTPQILSESVEGGSEGLLRRLEGTPPANWPDIIVAHPQALRRLVDSERIVPPSVCSGSEASASDLLPAVRATYSYRGELQATPFGVSTPVLLYDAAEFREAGLDPTKPPQTLDQLAAASEQVVSSGVSPHGLVVTDWYTNFLINQGAAQRGDLVAMPANGREGGDLTVDYNTPANVELMKWLTDVIDAHGGFYQGQVPSGLEDLIRIAQPANGAVMSIHTSGSLGDLIAFLEGGSFPGVELGVGPMPGTRAGGLVGGNGLWMVQHDDPTRLGAAYQVVSWLTGPAQLGRLVAATGYIPPSFSVAEEPMVLEAWRKYPQLRVGFDQLAAQDDSLASAGAVFGPSVEIDYLFYGFTDRIVLDRAEPGPALDQLSGQVNDLLQQYDAIVG